MGDINAGFNIQAQQAVDQRSFNLVAGASVPYTSTAQVLATLDVNQRHEGLIVYVTDGSVVSEYWFLGGVADVNLVIRQNAYPVQVLVTGADEYDPPVGSLVEKIVITDPDATRNVKIGTTPGGDDVMGEQYLFATGSGKWRLVFALDYFVDEAVTLYFTGYGANTVTTIYKR